jgi:hypothetical protein
MWKPLSHFSRPEHEYRYFCVLYSGFSLTAEGIILPHIFLIQSAVNAKNDNYSDVKEPQNFVCVKTEFLPNLTDFIPVHHLNTVERNTKNIREEY